VYVGKLPGPLTDVWWLWMRQILRMDMLLRGGGAPLDVSSPPMALRLEAPVRGA